MMYRVLCSLAAVVAIAAFSPDTANAGSGYESNGNKTQCKQENWFHDINKLFGAENYDKPERPGVPRTATTTSFDRPRTSATPATYPVKKMAHNYDDSTTVGWINHHIFGMGSYDISQRPGVPRAAGTFSRDIKSAD